jgi:hypothetical protein
MEDEYVDLLVEGSKLSFIPDTVFDDNDLVIQDGDLVTILGDEAIKKSIIRRITTNTGAYEVVVKTYEYNNVETGSEIISDIITLKVGTTYGSDIGKMLSEPLSFSNIQKIKSKLLENINLDPRINVTDIEVQLNQETGSLIAKVNYELVGSGQTSSTTVAVSPTA